MQAFYFSLFPILGWSLFSSATGISAGTGVSLSAWTKACQGRETNFREHGEGIRPALFNAHARSGRHFATWGEFLLSTSSCKHRYGLHFCLECQMAPSRLIITCLFVIRVILIQPRYLARVLLFLQWWKLFWQLSSAFLVSSCFKWI